MSGPQYNPSAFAQQPAHGFQSAPQQQYSQGYPQQQQQQQQQPAYQQSFQQPYSQQAYAASTAPYPQSYGPPPPHSQQYQQPTPHPQPYPSQQSFPPSAAYSSAQGSYATPQLAPPAFNPQFAGSSPPPARAAPPLPYPTSTPSGTFAAPAQTQPAYQPSQTYPRPSYPPQAPAQQYGYTSQPHYPPQAQAYAPQPTRSYAPPQDSTAKRASASAAFKQLDRDNSGYLDRNEFYSAMTALGTGLSWDDSNAIFGLIDSSGDGRVSHSEFLNHYLANY